jgi:cell division protein FtsW
MNMGVNVNILPVTGLALPMVSKGGTSVLFSGIAFGMILSVSRYIEKTT